MGPRWQSAMIVVCLVTLSSGCLFPPVEERTGAPDQGAGVSGAGTPGPGGEPGGGGSTAESPFDPDEYNPRVGRQTDNGTFSVRAEVQGGLGAGEDPHTLTFVLPPRVLDVSVELDWADDPQTTQDNYDLDLEVVLRYEMAGEEPEDVWGPVRDDGGQLGAPDAPIQLDSEEDEGLDDFALVRPGDTRLEATVRPKQSAGITYTIEVRYTHLTPKG